MCYYVSQKLGGYVNLAEIGREAEYNELLDRPVVGGFGGQPIAAMKPTGDRKNFEVVGMEWGFLPPYVAGREDAKKFKMMYTTLNATSEGLLINAKGNKSMFATAARERRCLVPVAGYYEWRHMPKYNKRSGELLKGVDKIPYFIRVKGQPVFYHAGIFQDWTDQDTGEVVETLAFCTTEANTIAAQIHNSKKRMPTMLNTELAKAWLFDTLTDDDITTFAKFQFPAGEMEAWTVDSKFLSLPDPTVACSYPEVPALQLEGNESPGGQPLSLF